MTPLSCLRPDWPAPYGWERTEFPIAPDASPSQKAMATAVRAWAHHMLRCMVSIDEGQLTMSCWWVMENDAHEYLRQEVVRLFIGSERPYWRWRRGADVAKQARDRAGVVVPDEAAFPVYAWHYCDPAELRN